ncbi:hypothetical protein D3C84_1073510 [compost metagenome]
MNQHTRDPEGVPNFDAMEDLELLNFHNEHRDGGKGWDQIFEPAVVSKEVGMAVTTQLSLYAWELYLARLDRHDGQIRRALECEALAQRIYEQLPEWARW